MAADRAVTAAVPEGRLRVTGLGGGSWGGFDRLCPFHVV